jgi:hypothetical protein
VGGPVAEVGKARKGGRIAYPLTNLLDGDPTTAWVYPMAGAGRNRTAAVPYLSLTWEEPVAADEVWLMNGYNKDEATFRRNNRVAGMRVAADDTEKETALSDRRGWHRVTLPRPTFRALVLEFLAVRRGPANDLCLSGLALYRRGRPVDFGMPRWVEYSEGWGDEGNDYFLMDRRGSLLEAPADPDGVFGWSPKGRYYAGREGSTVWVADCRAGRIVRRVAPPFAGRDTANDVLEFTWDGDAALILKASEGSETKPVTRIVRLP